ncbi:hypothetical protein V502_06249 [Pseudogymnoascus sp. VKM F-4520 (FW-2644)]|nr:hypothetical protein V502_06249 [Pseudogymnoascus sp. VKM F-4520 (FW-2644)]
MTTISEIGDLFDDHPSLDASLADFEPGSSEAAHSPRFPPPPFNRNNNYNHLFPSQHSGFREPSDSEDDPIRPDSSGGYSPPAWRRTAGARSSGFWNRRDNILNRGGASREASPETWESAEEGDATLAAAARVRLPTGSLSPEKRRSPSPDAFMGGGDFGRAFGGVKKEEVSGVVPLATIPENPNNYIRFAVRAEVQHRTEPFENALAIATRKFDSVTKSWTSLITTILVGFLSLLALKSIFTPAAPMPVPDLVKVASLAKSFEPLIFYSEHGIQQIADLQATSVAVWDLGESVRSANMTSAPIIVRELDGLSDSLKTLAIELTRFFANVDGDVDGILIVMDWAKRELAALPAAPPSPLSSLATNTHALLSRLHVLESSPGNPTALGHAALALFGPTPPQRTAAALGRAFREFVGVLEEAIQAELEHAAALFALFEAVDRRFLNVARAVARESDEQERGESEMLASLWTRVLGGNAAGLRKFENNRRLLGSVRERTVRNKRVLVDHNGKLLALRANLEMLRMRLVSPLVRAGEGSTIGVEEQIRGLEGTYEYLRGVREKQKGRLMEVLYGSGGGRSRIVAGDEDGREIDGGWERS